MFQSKKIIVGVSQTISQLTLVAIAFCLLTGCSPTPSKNESPPVPQSRDSRENSAKKVGEAEQIAPESTADDDDPTFQPDPVIVNNPAFHEALVAAANEYLEYGMVNSAVLAAPEACAPAMQDSAAEPRMSHSDDDSTHGHKLYFLFAKQIAHYLTQDGTPAPIGQALVKESWMSKPSNPNARNFRNHASGNRINPRTRFGDQILEIGQRKQLFVMLKLAPDTPDTDHGWVYGIVEPESKQVTEAGNVPSCIRCHQDAQHDRLFGPANPPL